MEGDDQLDDGADDVQPVVRLVQAQEVDVVVTDGEESVHEDGALADGQQQTIPTQARAFRFETAVHGHTRYMGFLGKALKAGVAKKAVDAARKPENQERVKALVAKAKARRRRGQPPASAEQH